MNRTIMMCIGLGLVLAGCSDAEKSGSINKDKLVKNMTLEEKARFVIGTGMVISP